MIEEILFTSAAIATIAGFILEIWRECRSDSEGKEKEKRGQIAANPVNDNPRRPTR